MKHYLTLLCALVLTLSNVSGRTMKLRLDAEFHREKQTMTALLAEIHRLYRDKPKFLDALDKAQSSWATYLSETIRARYPDGVPAEDFAEARVALPLVKARVWELRIWVDGIEPDSPLQGTVKLKTELEELRKNKNDEQDGADQPATAPESKEKQGRPQ